ncbi:MAG: orotidine-5'-phosphate decarboxylase [Parachlamydiales bacterium]|nr:orotidine-5'-phosphate decarboxylase [Parachlamydiales bacterium]
MPKRISFLKRASLTRHQMSQKLFKIMEDKKSNLCLAADVTSQAKLLEMADTIGPDLCILKTHVDILEDYTPDFGSKLRLLADKHNFLIFEDRKFADIGQTVWYQFTKGIYHIAEWAHIINAHIVPGPGIIEGLKGSSLLLLAEMSSHETVAKGAYTKKAVAMAEKYPETVMGFICLHSLTKDPGMLHLTPGVKLEPGKDALGQRYRTVDEILIKNKSDIIIVGRDITHAKNPIEAAAIYRKRGWECYVQTLA